MAAQQRMLATIIEALPDPILVVDQTLTVRQANAAARRSFTAPDPPVPLVRVLRDPGVLAAVTGALAGTTASSVTFSPTHDRAKQFSARVEPVDLGEGGQGLLLAFREQTEQVMIERMRSDFVANASHEIRTPLASIQGFIETLRGPAKHDPKAREQFLEIMAEEAARMGRLVDDLLSLSRIELAANEPLSERCNPRDALLYGIERVRAAAEKNSVRLELEIPDTLPPIVGDVEQLHQLFVNLVDNAIKYGGANQTVRNPRRGTGAGTRLGWPGSRARCRPSQHHRPRSGDRQGAFAAPDRTVLPRRAGRTRRLGGTGLGLAIVKHILRRHQGHLGIESTPGAGSTFSIVLPVAAADEPSVTELS